MGRPSDIGFWRGRWRSLGFAAKGLATLFREQANARFHLVAALAAISLAALLGLPLLHWMILIVVIGMVIAAEALNTAIEYLADATVPEQHPLIAKCKDVAAAGVMITAATALLVGLLLFLPPLIALF